MSNELLSMEELMSLYSKDFSFYPQKWSSIYNEPNKWKYLGVVWEAYGDRHYYKELETGDIYSFYISIGD